MGSGIEKIKKNLASGVIYTPKPYPTTLLQNLSDFEFAYVYALCGFKPSNYEVTFKY